MEKFGEFFHSITRLADNLAEVRMMWTDQTAQSYDQINDNMAFFSAQIWDCHNNALACYDAVKANYNESEFDDELNRLIIKCNSI